MHIIKVTKKRYVVYMLSCCHIASREQIFPLSYQGARIHKINMEKKTTTFFDFQKTNIWTNHQQDSRTRRAHTQHRVVYSRWGCSPGCRCPQTAACLVSPRRRWTDIRACTGRSCSPRRTWPPAACSPRWRAAGWSRSRSNGPGSWIRSRWRLEGSVRCRRAGPPSGPAPRSAGGSSRARVDR